MNTTTGLSDPSDSARGGDTTAHTPTCTVCAQTPGAIRPLMSREHPVCHECYVAWYDCGETDPAAILKHRNVLRQIRADLAALAKATP